MTHPLGADARFPGRPTHEDFARLSAALHANDGAVDFIEALSRFADPASVEYMAKQRAMMISPDPNVQLAVAAAWMDAFAAGVGFERSRVAGD